MSLLSAIGKIIDFSGVYNSLLKTVLIKRGERRVQQVSMMKIIQELQYFKFKILMQIICAESRESDLILTVRRLATNNQYQERINNKLVQTIFIGL